MTPILTIDGSEAQSNKPIDPGMYEFLCESISDPKQGAKAAYVTWIFVCQHEDFLGRKVYHNTPINGKGAGMFFELAGKINGEDYDVDNIENLEIDTDELLNESVMGTVKHREYNGEMQHEISKFSRM